MTAVIAYDIIIPGFLYLYCNMRLIILRNWDIALITGIGMVMNLISLKQVKGPICFHVYQGLLP